MTDTPPPLQPPGQHGGGQYGYVPQYAVPSASPGVVTWFKVYVGAMAVLYLLVTGLGLFMYAGADTFLSDPDLGPEAARIQGVVLAAIGIPLAALFAAGVFLPNRPWVWIYDIVLIAIGLTSCCFWPATIPLLIYWIKPEVRVWFGRPL